MAAVSLRVGDLVWGKLGRYPPWPGKIVHPPKDLKKPRGKKCFFVKFFGTEDHAWIKVDQLKSYHLHKEEMIKSTKGKRFQQAVDAVEEFIKSKVSALASSEDKNRHFSSDSKRQNFSATEISEHSTRKRGRPPKEEKDAFPEPSTVKRLVTGPVAGYKWKQVKDDPHFHHFLLSQSEKSGSCSAIIQKLKTTAEEEAESTSIQAADSTATNGSVTPTDKRIGFLGLGLMGSGIVANLLKMGHTVTVWNRTGEKCDRFLQEGARLGRTPAEVVSMCDITLSCISDPKAAKDLVLGPSGVLQGIRPGKCYVDMSTVDPETSIEISQVITSRGGRFLEAPVSGNRQLSENGMLVILAAGDKALFDECSSCFQAMGKKSFYLGEVGNASKMMLIVNMILGSFMASLAEGFTLAKIASQSQDVLLYILSQGPLASSFLDQKCQNILQGNFKPDFLLKHIQKDLRLAIAMGDSVNHSTPMAAAANEVFKKAKALDQSENDMSAVYLACNQ
ncbi:cytokine-like nuclear factor N-PAC isoform X1 [Stegostoma tigrinum]|uniref:cytokine-like nuclear factor N-PAC isoform X1 n=1 Tax=Stegostoma tigrinum TaxID=3053191 RepID=UPI00202B21F3|nr:cytokine-like nuclear factor N-PAC isoform X1 [Stegostoma tigrinum]